MSITSYRSLELSNSSVEMQLNPALTVGRDDLRIEVNAGRFEPSGLQQRKQAP